MLLALLLTAVAGDVVESAPAPEPLRHSSFGAYAGLSAGSGMAGYDLVGELGAQLFGLRDFDRTVLLFWDAALAARAGGLANTRPYSFFGGFGVHGSGELGRRFISEDSWSPYLAVRAGAGLSMMWTPGVPITALNTVNNSDGFGGITADALLRVSAGPSYLAHGRSLIAALFVQEVLHAPRAHGGGSTFTEGGLSLRFDLPERFTLAVEGLLGITPPAFDPALGTTTQTTHLEASGFLRKTFANGVWFGLSLSYGGLSARVAYQGGLVYDVAHPADFAVGASFGIPVGVKL